MSTVLIGSDHLKDVLKNRYLVGIYVARTEKGKRQFQRKGERENCKLKFKSDDHKIHYISFMLHMTRIQKTGSTRIQPPKALSSTKIHHGCS